MIRISRDEVSAYLKFVAPRSRRRPLFMIYIKAVEYRRNRVLYKVDRIELVFKASEPGITNCRGLQQKAAY